MQKTMAGRTPEGWSRTLMRPKWLRSPMNGPPVPNVSEYCFVKVSSLRRAI